MAELASLRDGFNREGTALRKWNDAHVAHQTILLCRGKDRAGARGMCFKFELGDVPDVEWGACEYVVDFAIGFDLDSRERISMAVALIENEEGGTDPFALNFGILRTPIDEGASVGPFFDHETCRKYVSRQNASAVMNNILASIQVLVEKVKPQLIKVSTYEEALPPAAMKKYYMICNHLGLHGFKMESYERDGTDRKDRWLFTR